MRQTVSFPAPNPHSTTGAAPRSLTVQQRKSTFPWRPLSICLDGYYLNTFDYSILFLIPTDPALFKSKTLFLSRRKDVSDPGMRREKTTVIFLGNDQVNTNLSTLLRSCPNNLPNQWFLMCWLSSLSVPLQTLICDHNEIPQLPTSIAKYLSLLRFPYWQHIPT